jgi:hypothetical protein
MLNKITAKLKMLIVTLYSPETLNESLHAAEVSRIELIITYHSEGVHSV